MGAIDITQLSVAGMSSRFYIEIGVVEVSFCDSCLLVLFDGLA